MWLIWNLFVFVAAYIAWSPEASRALTSKGVSSTLRTYLLSAPGQFIRLAVPVLWAVAAFALFSQDANLSQYFFPNGPDQPALHVAQAMPLVLGKIVPAGLLGLLVAGLMAAFMSTHDSYFLCWSSVIVRDVVAPLRSEAMSDAQQIRLARIIIVIIGAFIIFWGIWMPLPQSVWGYMAVTGTMYLSGAGVVIIGGMYWHKASSTGAMVALLGGLIAVVGLFIDTIHAQYYPDISKNLLSGVMGVGNFIFCGVLFVIFSLLWPDPPATGTMETQR